MKFVLQSVLVSRTWAWVVAGLLLGASASAVPAIQNVSLAPTPLRVGEPFSLSVTATDVVQGTATVDFRPWSPRILRITLSLQGGQWKGTGVVPGDLVPPVGAEATVKVLMFNGARQVTQQLLRVGVVKQAGITAVYDPGTEFLTVTGTLLDDVLTVGRDAAGSLRVNNGTVPITGGVATIGNTALIRILGLGGNDEMTLDITQGALPSGDLQGGPGNDVLVGGTNADHLDGGAGNDTVTGRGGADLMVGGQDNDTLVWNPGDGSDVLEGQSGEDTLLFNGANAAENIDLAANGGRFRFFRDVANIVMDADDVEIVRFNALGGADRVTVGSLAGTDISQVVLDLGSPAGSGTGDGAADTVVVNGSPGDEVVTIASTADEVQVLGLSAAVKVVGSDGPLDQLAINAQAGADVVNASALSAGRMGLVINGGLGVDVLIGSAGDDLMAGGDGDDTAFGGAGDDTIVWNPGDDNDVVEGQSGLDTLLFNGANVAENIDLAANGGRVIFFRNVASVVMDLNDVETVRFNALGGADTVVINDLSGTDVSLVSVDLANPIGSGTGDGQADTVIVQGTSGDDVALVTSGAEGVEVFGLSAVVRIAGSESANDRLFLRMLAGDDALEASGLQDGFLRLTEDGGDDDDVLVGSEGPDVLIGGNGDDVLIGGDGLDVLDGGPGDDIEIQ